MELGSSTEYAPFVEERVEDGPRHRRSLWLPVLLVAGCLVAFDLITPSFTSERRTWRRQWLEQWVQQDGYSPCGPATLLLNVEGVGSLRCGAEVHLKDVKRWNSRPPQFAFAGAADGFYALAVVDADAPSEDDPSSSEYRHWLVGNIPGSELHNGNVTRAHELTHWLAPAPPAGSGRHRLVFLLWSEYGPAVSFDVVPSERARWDAQAWADGYGFGPPVAATYLVVDTGKERR